MTFSIARFARTNKVFLIWTAFGALLYLMRDLFGLVFITYIMCFIINGLTHRLHRSARIRRRFMVVVIYLLFLAGIAALIFFLSPRLLTEAKNFTEQLPRTLATIGEWTEAQAAANDTLAPIAERIRHLLTPEQMIVKGWALGRGALEKIVHYISWFFLALLFSFLIMLDLPRLVRSVRELRFTRLSSVYAATADSVILFAKVVGENFRAQIMISTVNTILTAIGLHILGIGGAVLLCTLVFICGLIPVLGVFISSVPILLMAVNAGGITLSLWALGMIILIHLIEAYVLNPRIVSAIMHLNPVMTLIILYIAHSLIGLWGMLLGVPISVYIYRQLIIGLKPKSRRNPPTGLPPGAPTPEEVAAVATEVAAEVESAHR